MNRLRIWLDDEPYELVPGARVIDLIQLLPEARRTAYAAGRLKVVDKFGNEVGSHGDLAPDQRLRLV